MTAAAPSPAPGEAYTLVDVGSGRRYALDEGATIGRDSGCAIRVNDPMVAPIHAEIRRAPEGLVLADLGSRHGTYVDGARVTAALLVPGSELLVGVVRFRVETARGSAPPRRAREPFRRLSIAEEPQFRRASDIHDHDHLKRDYERLRAAVELARRLAVQHDVELVLAEVVDASLRLFDADQGGVVLVDRTGRPTREVGRDRLGRPVQMSRSATALGEIAATGAAVLLADPVLGESVARSASIVAGGIQARMAAPLAFGDELLGVLEIDSLRVGCAFEQRDLELFATVAQHAALAIKNAELVGAVRAVRAEEWRRLERVVAGLPYGVVLLDAERRVVLVNARGAELLGAFGAKVGEAVSGFGPTSIEDVLGAAAGRPIDLVTDGASPRIFEVSATAPDEDAAVVAETVLLVRDVTSERAREEREAQAQRLALVGQLAGGVAHDFNNLMAVVLSYAELVRDEVADMAVAADVEEIRHAALRATDVTKQLLAFSRRDVVAPRAIDVAALVARMENMLTRTLGEAIRLEVRCAAELPTVKADPTRVEQVLLNLVVNARDALPRGGSVVIEVELREIDAEAGAALGLEAGTYVATSVRDDGVGMAREVAARVFEPFFTTKERGKGTGLGLSTAYGIAQQAGGTLTVKSRPGEGATFTMWLPAFLGLAVASERGPARAGRRASGTVLIAEDEPAVRGLARRLLAEAGLEVLVAVDGESALAQANARPGTIDLLLTDLVMPGMSGKQLAEQLCAARPDTEVIYMSGYLDDDSLGADVTEGLVHFVPKPFSRKALVDKVLDVLSSRRTGSIAAASGR